MISSLRLGHVELFVSDPLIAMQFYVGILGFELVENQGDKYIWLKLGDALILLRPTEIPAHHSPTYQSAASAIVLYTDDLDSTVVLLRSRGLEFKGVDGSPQCLTFTDVDGNWFQLVNPANA